MATVTAAAKQTAGPKITYTFTYSDGTVASLVIFKTPAAPAMRWSWDVTWSVAADHGGYASWSEAVASLDAELNALGFPV